MIESTKRFLLVDDDVLTNSISKMILKRSLGDVEVKDFLMPEEALEYIQTEFECHPSDKKVTIFLDINMPNITGWQFLEKFKGFKDQIKMQFNIYMLSSSTDPVDIRRVNRNPLVLDLIEKPFSKALITKMFG